MSIKHKYTVSLIPIYIYINLIHIDMMYLYTKYIHIKKIYIYIYINLIGYIHKYNIIDIDKKRIQSAHGNHGATTSSSLFGAPPVSCTSS